MRIIICEDKNDLGLEASKLGINLIRQAIEERGEAAIAVGTGLSQFSLYAHLCKSGVLPLLLDTSISPTAERRLPMA